MGGGAGESVLRGRLHGVTDKTGMDMVRIILVVLLLLLATSAFGADAIIGDTAQTGTSEAGYPGNARMLSHADYQYTASAGDVVDSLCFYTWQSSGGTIDIAVYDITSGDTTMVGSAVTITATTTKKVHKVDVNIELTAGNKYVVAVGNETGSVGYLTAALADALTYLGNEDPLPATWSYSSIIATRYVMYGEVVNGEPPEESDVTRRRRLLLNQ